MHRLKHCGDLGRLRTRTRELVTDANMVHGFYDSSLGIARSTSQLASLKHMPYVEQSPLAWKHIFSRRDKHLLSHPRWGYESWILAIERTSRPLKSSLKRSIFCTPPLQSPTVICDTKVSLSEQVRSVLRLLVSPVVVCTSTQDTEPRAMTMSSFTSLSLTPTPLITFNVATPSRTLDAIVSSREFNIHILSGSSAGAAIAEHFTRGNADGLFRRPQGTAISGNNGSLLSGDGVLSVLHCKLFQEGFQDGLAKIRDHVVVVGEVFQISPGNSSADVGLTYANRRYRRAGSMFGEGRRR